MSSFTDDELRQLSAADRMLSGDPVLRATADLFPRPPIRTDRPVLAWRAAHRLLLVMLWSLAAMAVGLATTVLTAALASPTVAVGLTLLFGAVTAFVLAATRRAATVSRAHPLAPSR
jgi:hypothetical protein